ncbi:MAG: hypothetical protein HYY52_01775 [Candidatus Melainabacteria bacterium]|nr:hypothetical protein [Candidatus Melainabacteria bacterium]
MGKVVRSLGGESGSSYPYKSTNAPLKYKGAKGIVDTGAQTSTNEQKNNDKVACAVNPCDFPLLFAISRGAVNGTELVTRFIKNKVQEVRESLSGNLEEYIGNLLKNSLKPDEELSLEVNRALGSVPYDFGSEFKSRLTSSEDPLEQVVILKMLFCLDRKDEVLSELMIPYLEEREYIGTKQVVENNNRFYLQFLQALDKKDLKDILLSFEYKDVIRADNLAYKLLEVSDSNLILDLLLKEYEPDVNLSLNDQIAAKQKVQTIALTILQKESTREELSEIDYEYYLVTLYKNSLSKKVSDDVATLLSRYRKENAEEIFLDQLLNREIASDLSEDNRRRRRSYAASHLSNHICDRDKLLGLLQRIVLNEEDPYVTGNVVCKLANDLGEEGKKALVQAIVEQVKNNITSLPLGCLNLLYIAENKDQYYKVLLEILSTAFDKTEGLSEAFVDLQDVELCPVSKDKNGPPFDPQMATDPEQVIDLIEKVGLEKFLEWATIENVKSEDKKALKANSQSLLNLACRLNPERIYEYFSWSLVNEPNSKTAIFIKQLAGFEQANKPNEVVDTGF